MRWRDVKQNRVKKESKKTTEPSIRYASISNRLKAFLTDTFMITMPILYIVIYLVMGGREGFRENMAEGWLYIAVPHYMIVVFLWSVKGETPGMKAYNLKLLNTSMQRPRFLQSTLRYVLMQISILSIIGLLSALFRKDKKAAHDILSKTFLVEAESEKG